MELTGSRYTLIFITFLFPIIQIYFIFQFICPKVNPNFQPDQVTIHVGD